MSTRLFVNVSQIYLPLYVTETLELPKVCTASQSINVDSLFVREHNNVIQLFCMEYKIVRAKFLS